MYPRRLPRLALRAHDAGVSAAGPPVQLGQLDEQLEVKVRRAAGAEPAAPSRRWAPGKQLAEPQIGEVLQRMSNLGPAVKRDLDPKRCCLQLVARRCAELGLVDDALQVIEQWPLAWEGAEALRTISGLLPTAAAGRIEWMARRLSLPTALCALAPLTQEPASLRAELLRAAEHDPSIYLKVLAADWRDESRCEQHGWMRWRTSASMAGSGMTWIGP